MPLPICYEVTLGMGDQSYSMLPAHSVTIKAQLSDGNYIELVFVQEGPVIITGYVNGRAVDEAICPIEEIVKRLSLFREAPTQTNPLEIAKGALDGLAAKGVTSIGSKVVYIELVEDIDVPEAKRRLLEAGFNRVSEGKDPYVDPCVLIAYWPLQRTT